MSSSNDLQATSNVNGNQDGHKTGRRLSDIKDDMPQWKKSMLSKRNEEILAEIEKEKEIEEAEKQKYATVPGWKAEIMKRKEEEKRRQEEMERQEELKREEEEREFKSKPQWQQELIKRRNSQQ